MEKQFIETTQFYLIVLLYFQGNAHPDDITCLAADAFLVFTACQNIIRAFTQGRQVRQITTRPGQLLKFTTRLVTPQTL